jgi:hypothetical protein
VAHPAIGSKLRDCSWRNASAAYSIWLRHRDGRFERLKSASVADAASDNRRSHKPIPDLRSGYAGPVADVPRFERFVDLIIRAGRSGLLGKRCELSTRKSSSPLASFLACTAPLVFFAFNFVLWNSYDALRKIRSSLYRRSARHSDVHRPFLLKVCLYIATPRQRVRPTAAAMTIASSMILIVVSFFLAVIAASIAQHVSSNSLRVSAI